MKAHHITITLAFLSIATAAVAWDSADAYWAARGWYREADSSVYQRTPDTKTQQIMDLESRIKSMERRDKKQQTGEEQPEESWNDWHSRIRRIPEERMQKSIDAHRAREEALSAQREEEAEAIAAEAEASRFWKTPTGLAFWSTPEGKAVTQAIHDAAGTKWVACWGTPKGKAALQVMVEYQDKMGTE